MNLTDLIDAMKSIKPAARCKELEAQLNTMAARAEAAEKECERLRSDMARVRLEARRLLGGSEQWAELARRARDLEHQLNALEPETPNHDRSQLEALGQMAGQKPKAIELRWVKGPWGVDWILKREYDDLGWVYQRKGTWRWTVPVINSLDTVRREVRGEAKTLEEAKALCEQYVREQLEGK